MSTPTSPSELYIYIWPSQWNLASFDPVCLATIYFLQLTVPDKYRVVETTNPDLSPNGQLPFLVHEKHTIATFPSIVRYIENLRNTHPTGYPTAYLDAFLSPSEKSRRAAWYTHILADVGDIVYYALYSSSDNWERVIRPLLSSFLSIPQRYYVPDRIREMHKPRLESAGLWSVPVIEKEEKHGFSDNFRRKSKDGITKTYTSAFEREKVLQRVRPIFDIYARLLGDKEYIYQNRPSSLDALLAGHIIVLLEPPYQNQHIGAFLVASYPRLVSHAHRINGSSSIKIPLKHHISHSAWSLLPVDQWNRSGYKAKDKTPDDIHYDRMRWGFLGLTLGSLAAYYAVVGFPFTISMGNQHPEEETEEIEQAENGDDISK